MNRKELSNIVMKLFLYGDMCKMIHYSTRKQHCHVLCDTVRDDITEFADELAEQAYGILGKPLFTDFSLRNSVRKTSDIGQLCKNVVNLLEPVRSQMEGKAKFSGIVSLMDDFKSKMSKNAYLATFDGVSSTLIKECADRVVDDYLL
jgi:hypothetical protein